jgi:hypothetical protein
MFTVLCVTNTNATPQNPQSFGGSTNIRFDYYNVTPNPGDPFHPLRCQIFDRVERLTPADTLCVLTKCHNPFPLGVNLEGFVVVAAENPNRAAEAWTHNLLIGGSMLFAGSGAAFQLSPWAFRGLTGPGNRTDLNNNAQRDLDGYEYELAPNSLCLDSFIAATNQQLAIADLGGRPRNLHTLYFSVWNDNEFALSTTLEFNCWFDQPLTAISTLFTDNFLRGTRHDPNELDLNCDQRGDVETGWFIVESAIVREPGGRALGPGRFIGAITGGPASCAIGKLLWECEPIH